MNPLVELLDTWAGALWRASWQGGLLALTVWIACRAVPSLPARFQSWLWRLVVLKFLVALIWAAPIELPILSAIESAASVTNSPVLPNSASADAAPINRHGHRSSFTPWLMVTFIWAVLASWQLVRLIVACHNVNRLRRNCRPCNDRQMLNQCASISRLAGLYRTPMLLESSGQGSPLLIGMLRPAVVLPAATLRRLDDAERSLVIRHELAHACRGDLFWILLAAVARALLFFHPLAWLCERRLILAQEIAADELASSLEGQDLISYARLLVSIAGKLGPRQLIPAMSAGTAGPHHTLAQRLLAMRFFKPRSHCSIVGYGCVLAVVAALCVVPWTLVSAETPAANGPQPWEKSGSGRGKFVSFENGTLTLKANDGSLLCNKVSRGAKSLQWNDEHGFQPVGTEDALKEVKSGTWMHVVLENQIASIRIGARKTHTTGTLVSFRDGRLWIRGKNLGESFTKKYGNQVHFNKFRDDVATYESIDGGEYRAIGFANKVLGDVKEGTLVTVHGEGDDNITRVDIGLPNKK